MSCDCTRAPADALCRSRPAGHSLVELLLALTIGLAVVAGAMALYARSRDLQRAADGHARLQEVARHALAVIEADLRLAGYRGLAPAEVPVALDPALVLPAKCGGVDWLAPAGPPVDGSNNRYLAAPDCAAANGGALPGTDVLVVRSASAERIVLSTATIPSRERDRVLLASARDSGTLFLPQSTGGSMPAGYPATGLTGLAPYVELRAWLVNAYYVSAGSSNSSDVPALRRKTLTGGPNVGDEEIAAGIEDLQFRVGTDTDGDSSVDSYFEPGTLPDGAVPLCVRIWLRVRSVERDNPLGGTAAASYADRHWAAIDDGYSRMLVGKTVLLRNASR